MQEGKKEKLDSTKNFKIKKIQLSKSADLEKLKAKLAGEKEGKKEKEAVKKPVEKTEKKHAEEEKPRRIRAKSHSAFEPQPESEKEELPESAPAEEDKAIKLQQFQTESAETKAPSAAIPPLPLQPPSASEALSLEPVAPSEPAPPPEVVVQEKSSAANVSDKQPPATLKASPTYTETSDGEAEEEGSQVKKKKVREFKDLKPKGPDKPKPHLTEEDDRWRKKRSGKRQEVAPEEPVGRPTSITISLPITVKELAEKMKRKSSELIQKLFIQGLTLTVNDLIDDELLIELIAGELNCAIRTDRSQDDRIQIVKVNVQNEIAQTDPTQLQLRPSVVTFMGHVDHGKTSLIDAIRKSNVAAAEAGAITQHIGAFRCKTAVGDITILDTPGHEAFSLMRARGAQVTDIVVLVVAGDEGMREQTFEAIEHAKAAGVTIMVAINKADKNTFNAELVWRQLSEADLLPEAWGGQIVTVNTSAVTGEGINQLLEMLALQAEVLELKANPHTRARGLVLESQMHKGLGATATILVQNGTLRMSDAVVIDHLWGRIKTMHDEHGKKLMEAPPSTPVSITGLSGLPKAGDSFVVVKNEREAREIAELRTEGMRQQALMQKKVAPLDTLRAEAEKKEKKMLKVVLRADVQGSLEALKNSLLKIKSQKVDIDVILGGIGEVSESDVEFAAASSAIILGFHTQVESMAANLARQKGVTIRLHDIIYHAIDDVKEQMRNLLDRIEHEKEIGRAEVRAIFKMGGLGQVAGCMVTDGAILRQARICVERQETVIWKGNIASLKRIKEDVKEVKKGLECGVLLNGFADVVVGDILVACEVSYSPAEL